MKSKPKKRYELQETWGVWDNGFGVYKAGRIYRGDRGLYEAKITVRYRSGLFCRPGRGERGHRNACCRGVPGRQKIYNFLRMSSAPGNRGPFFISAPTS